MAVAVTTWVWKHAPVQDKKLLLLLAIADCSNTEGIAYPGVARIAQYIRASERHTQRLIKDLEKANIITVVRNKGDRTPTGYTNLYYLNGYRESEGLTEGEGVTSGTLTDEKGVTSETQGVTNSTARGDIQVSPKQKITNATKKSSIPKGIDTAAENGDGERTFSKAETIPSMDEKTTEDVLDNRPPHKDYFAALMDISWPPTMFVPSNSLMGRVAKWLRTNGYQPEEGEAIVEYVTEIAQKDEWTTRWHLTCVETFAADWQARVRDDSVLTPLLRKKLKLIGQDFSAPGLRKAIAEGWFDPAHEGFGFDLDGAIRDLGLEVPT